MTDKERITELENRLARAEARIAMLEARPMPIAYPPIVQPMPANPWPQPWWQSPVTCGGAGGEVHFRAFDVAS